MALRRGKGKKPRARITPEDYEVVMLRRGGRCEGGLPGTCTGRAGEWHHRQRRNVGHNRPSNGAALCHACHDYITHRSPALGRERGLIVSSYADDPGAVPMLVGRSWWLLDDRGGMTHTDAPPKVG